MDKVRVRIAPSPTGFLHIGTARTAFFNWLYAKKSGGEFILRIEDTDLERSNKKYEEDIIEGLKWLGLDWSNKEIIRQSERLDIYEKYLKQLLDSGKAFWCDHSKEELETEQKEQTSKKEAPRHICSHRSENLDKGQVIRLANSISPMKMTETAKNQTDSFVDMIRGEIHAVRYLFGDFSLAKDLRTPLYNFAAVIDDIDMEISHVIRGEDHISNTPKQLLIYEALEKTPPIFAHLPLILAPDRSKLSKRHGATSVNEFKKDYLPEALINFMGFLGYTYDKEILKKEEMAQEFELKKVHKSGAIFDIKKLNWINSQYLKNVDSKRLRDLTGINDIPETALPLITERLEKLSDVSSFDYFWKEPEYDKGLLKWKKADLEKSIETLKEVKKIIEDFDFKDKDELRKLLDELSSRIGDPATILSADHHSEKGRDWGGAGRGLVYWPLRVALTGKDKSPDPVDIAFVLGKDSVIKKVGKGLKL